MTLVAVDAIVDRVFDLTDADVRKALGLTMAQLTGCRWREENVAGREAVTQALGRAADACGFQGILVPSSVKRTFRNLNVFPLGLGVTGSLRIRGADKLPPPPAPGIM
jgi:RES domain-containing protein